MTFYLSDPELVLPHLEGAFVRLDEGNLLKREDLSQGVMQEVEKVMFTDRWNIYSFRNFFGTIIDFTRDSQ